MTALTGTGMRFNLRRAVCWAIMDARDGAGEIRRPWGELVVAHALTPSDYDLECRSLPEISGRAFGLKNRAKIRFYNSP